MLAQILLEMKNSLKKSNGDGLDFDAVIATPDMMRDVGKLGKDTWATRLDADSKSWNSDKRCRQSNY